MSVGRTPGTEEDSERKKRKKKKRPGKDEKRAELPFLHSLALSLCVPRPFVLLPLGGDSPSRVSSKNNTLRVLDALVFSESDIRSRVSLNHFVHISRALVDLFRIAHSWPRRGDLGRWDMRKRANDASYEMRSEEGRGSKRTTGSSNTSTLIQKCEEISFDTSTLLQDPNQNGGLSSFGGVMSYAARTLASQL
uniref:Uncharacterized protein n=1 Tax=Vespula pensylvanica TaxID=30213 RepID=A0A834JRW2_VESPE|nr:hypothetical protein H0235_017276 [Vespula pensylvanica]